MKLNTNTNIKLEQQSQQSSAELFTRQQAISLLLTGEQDFVRRLDQPSETFSPSRLQDIFINTDTLSAAQMRQLGVNHTMVWGIASSILGDVFIAGVFNIETGVITALSQLDFDMTNSSNRQVFIERSLNQVRRDWPAVTLQRDDNAIKNIAEHIINPNKTKTTYKYDALPVYVRGTGFQIKVWQALLYIPSGSVVSYGAIATALGNPKASRAVGTAVGSNPISLLIPCHRVIQRSGALGGYAWGLSRKVKILQSEQK